MKKLFVLLIAIFTIASNLSAQTVYITKTGSKYHLDGCRYLSRSEYAITLSDAISRGYSACSVCKPPTSASTKTQPSNAPVRENSSSTSENKSSTYVQCSAITKAGARCKRMTKNPNGLCWQHGGS